MFSIYFIHDFKKIVLVGSLVTSLSYQVVELATHPRKIYPDVVEFTEARIKNESGVKVYGNIHLPNIIQKTDAQFASAGFNGVNVINLM